MSRRLPVTLTDGEVESLLAQVKPKSTTGLRNRAMLAAMLGAGLRVSEVCTLRGVDVDLAEGMVRVNLGKGRKDRVIPVDHETLAWLRAWAERREKLGANGRQPFFCRIRTRGITGRLPALGAVAPRTVQLLIGRLARAAGIEKRVTPHTLRHTYATRMLRRGFTIREVQELLGHASVATTQVYTHVDPQALKEKVQGKRPTQAEEIAQALLANQVRLVTDNGSSFTARVFQEFLGRVKVFRHVRVSYRSPELIALIERLHRTLKEEHIRPALYETDLQAREELAGYVEFHNEQRVHQALGYCTPMEVYTGDARPGPGAWAGEDQAEEYVTAACLACPGQAV